MGKKGIFGKKNKEELLSLYSESDVTKFCKAQMVEARRKNVWLDNA